GRLIPLPAPATDRTYLRQTGIQTRCSGLRAIRVRAACEALHRAEMGRSFPNQDSHRGTPYRVATERERLPSARRPQITQRTRAVSFDHLVGAGENRRRNFKAQRYRGFKADNQVEFGWLLDG